MMKNRARMLGGMFCGDLSEGIASRILKVRDMECVPAFKNEIYDFPRAFREEAARHDLSAYDYALQMNVLDKYIGKLRDYQTVGAAFMYASPRSMLGDPAGTGKTPQVCAVLNKLRRMGRFTRCIAAAEASAVEQLAAEIARFTGLRVVRLHSLSAKMLRQTAGFRITHKPSLPEEAKSLIDFDVLIISHSTLRSDTFYTWLSRVVDEFGTFILDESYVVKNPDTMISGYVRVLCSKMSRVHFLNATVFETRLLDVANQFDVLYPFFLPTRRQLELDFCRFKQSTFPIRGGGGRLGTKRELVSYKNQDIFRQALALVYLARKREDLIKSDTERSYQVCLIPQTKAQKAAIRKGYRYFEVLNCPSLCADIDITNDPKCLPKLSRLIELVSEDFEGRSIVIYAWHIEIQETIKHELEKIGRRVAILNGSTKERDQLREDFNDGVYDVLVTNAKRSLNLQRGDACIFYSVETNPASIEQIARRIDRNVDDASKTFVLLAYEGAEVNFFINAVTQRAADSSDLTAVTPETVLKFGEILSEILNKSTAA